MAFQDNHAHVLALTRELDPFEIATLGISLLYGMLGTVFYDQVASAAIRSYPGFGGRVFLVALVLGSLTALLGLVRNTLRHFRLERAGLHLLCWLCLLFLVWSPFSAGARGTGLMIYMGLLVSIPSFVVARRRGRQIRAAEKVIRARPEE